MSDAPEEHTEAAEDDLAPMDFSVLVLSLRASAMMNLGQGTDGSPGEVDLPLASQSISMLTLLEDKTRGNLTGEEERLLSQAIFDVRKAFAAAAGAQGE